MALWNFVFFFSFPQSRHCIRPSSFERHSTQLSSSPADPFPPFPTFTARFCSLVHVKLLGTGATPHRVSLDNPQVHADEMEETQNTWWLDARWDHIRKGKTEKERPLAESCTTAATRAHAHTHTPPPSDPSQGFISPTSDCSFHLYTCSTTWTVGLWKTIQISLKNKQQSAFFFFMLSTSEVTELTERWDN